MDECCLETVTSAFNSETFSLATIHDIHGVLSPATARLLLSYLPPSICQDLFSSVGTIKQAMVKFDKNGRSTGQAEVVFANKNDALEAIKKYNGVPLDNRPLKISLSTTHTTEAPLRSDAAGSSG